MSEIRNRSKITSSPVLDGEETQSFQLNDVPRATLAGLEAVARSQRPPTSRNELIRFILDEVAAGRLPIPGPGSAAA